MILRERESAVSARSLGNATSCPHAAVRLVVGVLPALRENIASDTVIYNR